MEVQGTGGHRDGTLTADFITAHNRKHTRQLATSEIDMVWFKVHVKTSRRESIQNKRITAI